MYILDVSNINRGISREVSYLEKYIKNLSNLAYYAKYINV